MSIVTETPSVHIRLKAATPPHLRAAHNVVLSIPQTSGRNALRKLVHHLISTSTTLSEEEKEPDFHFLIQGEPLRTTLDKYIERRKLSIENTIEITYYLPLPQPEKQTSIDTSSEWLSNLSIYYDEENYLFHILAASYSGLPFYYTYHKQTNETINQNQNQSDVMKHNAPIKDIAWINNRTNFITASSDENGILWNVNNFEQLAIFRTQDCGQSVGLNCVSVNENNNHILFGSEDGILWYLPNLPPPPTSTRLNTSENTNKKRQFSDIHIPSIPAIKLGNGSPNLPTTSIQFFNDNNQCASTGFDSLIRTWDIETTSELLTIPAGGKPIHDIDYSNKLFAVAAIDGAVRLVDSKGDQGVVAACGKKQSHNGVVSAVSWLGNESHQFVSSGFDGSIRMWDVRAMISPVRVVQNIHGNQHKIFDVKIVKDDEKSWIFYGDAAGKIGSLTL